MAGALHLAFENLPVPGPEEQRLRAYLPADAATADTLAALEAPALVS